MSFSSETQPTVWRTIPTLELLQERWETFSKNKKRFGPVSNALEKGLDKLRKWYMSLDETDTNFICLGM